MGKHTRLAKPRVVAASVDLGVSTGERAEAMLKRTITHLETLLGAVEATLEAGDANPALARESAGVARAMTGLAAEVRQREKHVKDMVAKMSSVEQDELIKTYLRDLPVERRAEFRDLLDDMDADEQVMA